MPRYRSDAKHTTLSEFFRTPISTRSDALKIHETDRIRLDLDVMSRTSNRRFCLLFLEKSFWQSHRPFFIILAHEMTRMADSVAFSLFSRF